MRQLILLKWLKNWRQSLIMNKHQVKKRLDELSNKLPNHHNYTITISGEDSLPVITDELDNIVSEIPTQKGPIDFIISISEWKDE